MPESTKDDGLKTHSPLVSIVIPVHAGGSFTSQSLAAAKASLATGDELVVVADGRSDPLIAQAQSVATRTVVLEHSSGPAAARNAGAAVARNPILFFVDSDVLIRREVVDAVRGAFESPELDAVIGSYDVDPPAPSTPSRYKNLLNHYVHQGAGGPAETFWGACGAVRAEAFAATGGFDEWYSTPSIEDIELGYRLVADGRRIELRPDIQVTHLKAWSLRNLFATDFGKRALPWAELLLARGSWQNSLNIDRTARTKVALTGIAAAALGFVRFRPSVAVRIAAICGAVIAGLDWRLIAFFRNHGGPAFALRAYMLHLASYFLSGVALVVAITKKQIGRSSVPEYWKELQECVPPDESQSRRSV